MTKQPEALRLADEMSKYRITDESVLQTATELRRLHEVNGELVEALKDMWSCWKYICEVHGDLYGVGWDRAQLKAQAAIAKATGEQA